MTIYTLQIADPDLGDTVIRFDNYAALRAFVQRWPGDEGPRNTPAPAPASTAGDQAPAPAPRRGRRPKATNGRTRHEEILELLTRPQGVTLDEVTNRMGILPNSAMALISVATRAKGLRATRDGKRYHVPRKEVLRALH